AAVRHPARQRRADDAAAGRKDARDQRDASRADAAVRGVAAIPRRAGGAAAGRGDDPAAPGRRRRTTRTGGHLPAASAGGGWGPRGGNGGGQGGRARSVSALRVSAVTPRFAAPGGSARSSAPSGRGETGRQIMLTCPLCQKELAAPAPRCPRCQADLALLTN